MAAKKDDGDAEAPDASAQATLAAAIARAEAALASLKTTLAEGDVGALGEQAAAAAAKLYREGEEFVARGQTISEAKSELRGSIRRHPLAAVGLAFLVGWIIALMTRG